MLEMIDIFRSGKTEETAKSCTLCKIGVGGHWRALGFGFGTDNSFPLIIPSSNTMIVIILIAPLCLSLILLLTLTLGVT